MINKYLIGFIFISIFIFSHSPFANAQSFITVKKIRAVEAHQGVAVDADYFYPVATRGLAKYDKHTGKKVAEWKEKESGPIEHLDSGVIVDNKLYAAHSNYPEIPMTSSVEVWDTETLQHIDSHSFGIKRGSFTWLDRYDGFWWGAFAHYEQFREQTGKDNSWTTLVKFDDNWNALESWVFPVEVLERFHPMSNSGGSWGKDGFLYVSGHDRPELYKMSFPDAGSVLVLEEIIPIESEGQGIAWDRSAENIIYSIHRDRKEVIVSEWDSCEC